MAHLSNKNNDSDENIDDNYEEKENVNTKLTIIDLSSKTQRNNSFQKANYSNASLKIHQIIKNELKNNVPKDRFRTRNNRNNQKIENKIYNNQKEYGYNILRKSGEAAQNLDEYFDNAFYSSGTDFIAFSTKLLAFCSFVVVGPIFITIIGII